MTTKIVYASVPNGMRSGRFFSILSFIFAILASAPSAHASEDDSLGYFDPETRIETFPSVETLSPVQNEALRYERFLEMLALVGVPKERAPDFSDFPANETVSYPGFVDLLPWIDRDQRLLKYMSVRADSVTLYRDLLSASTPESFVDFSTSFSASPISEDSPQLMSTLRRVAGMSQDLSNPLPLKGLRIAIDPGHMGGKGANSENWDAHTGKWVEARDANGTLVHVSEGELTLLTALLTANELERLGATVMLTREALKPVVADTMKNFDYQPTLNRFFYESLDSSWLAPYFSKSDAEVKRLLPNDPHVPNLKNGNDLDTLFNNADLFARVEKINAFHPHITIDIHYDARINTQLQNTVDTVQVMIPGSFMTTELGSRANKAVALKHSLEPNRWNASRKLASAVTNAVAGSLGLKLTDAARIDDSFKVEDGVYARNLAICRNVRSGLMVYLEALHYDHVNEFFELAKRDQSSSYHGMTFRYSGRMAEVATGLTHGILNYFRNSMPMEFYTSRHK